MFCDAMFENVMILYESNLDDCYQYPDPPELFFSGSAQVNDIRKAMSEVEFSGSPRVETAGLDCEITSQLAPFGCLAAVYLEGPTPISFGAYVTSLSGRVVEVPWGSIHSNALGANQWRCSGGHDSLPRYSRTS